ncbi:MAG: histidine triad nucleotide-binding protein [Nitrospinae bacterium CG11_big_fil_rev_8_21_14_0_20_56_8]|nr:MAG: histidine triad nucleotide-binding protein [Nitrospinae bacterium CG11_big_fil_rev_8_21_14_0_20_56_8]
MDDCLFCRIREGKIPAEKVHEDELVFAIKDINPQAPTHLLIIPHKHQETLMELETADRETIGTVFTVAGKLARERGLDKSGFRVVANCGSGAGQSVWHIHFHLLGGRGMKWPPG